MQAKVQNMSHSYGYIKCGEIFQSQQSFDNPYILRCIACQEMYLLLESFILHFKDECKIARSTKTVFHNAKLLKEDAIKNSSVILETYNMEDPLIRVSGSAEILDNPTQDYEVINATTQNEYKLQDTAANETLDDSLSVLKSEIIHDNEISPTKQYSNLSENNIKTKTDFINSFENMEESTSDDNEPDEQQLVQQSYTRQCSYKYFNIKQFMNSQTNVSILIAAYKKQPNLWNKNVTSLRYKEKRPEYLQEIANELKDQANIVVTWDQVAAIIVHICQKYRESLNRLKSNEECKEESNKYIPLWYFEDLYFLKPFVEKNLIAKLGLYLPELLPDEIIKILNIYKGYSHLWNTQIIEFYCKNKRNEAIQEMLQALETNMNLKISEHILEEYLRTVHKCFSRAKRKNLNIPKKGEKKDVDDEENKEDYYEHMIFLFDHVGPFKCSECERETKTALMYKIHKSQHNGSAPLTCSVCKREFTSPSTYINHAKRHMEDSKFECKECGKKFYASRELDIHMRNHTGTKPFTCEICGTSFRHVQSLSTHQRRHEKKYLHTCHICSKGFYTMDSFKDHMNRHSNTRTHVCNVCNKTFINKKGLRIHEVIHEDIRKHECKICHKTFKHRTGLNQHMKTHNIAKTVALL